MRHAQDLPAYVFCRLCFQLCMPPRFLLFLEFNARPCVLRYWLQGGVPTSHLILEGILIISVIYLFFFTKTYRIKKLEKLTPAVPLEPDPTSPENSLRTLSENGRSRKKSSFCVSGNPSHWFPSSPHLFLNLWSLKGTSPGRHRWRLLVVAYSDCIHVHGTLQSCWDSCSCGRQG